MNVISRVGTSHNIPLEEPELLSIHIRDWMKAKNKEIKCKHKKI